MKGDKKIIDILNELLAGELTAVDQYLLRRDVCRYGAERAGREIDT
ncbi:hypothetical protein [Azonexus hydrophilus]